MERREQIILHSMLPKERTGALHSSTPSKERTDSPLKHSKERTGNQTLNVAERRP
jgi:hypothetical protein